MKVPPKREKMLGRIPSSDCCRLALLVVQQLKNLPQGIQLRHGIEAAREALAKIRACHPERQINDHLIDLDFEVCAKVVSHTANYLAFLAKEGV